MEFVQKCVPVISLERHIPLDNCYAIVIQRDCRRSMTTTVAGAICATRSTEIYDNVPFGVARTHTLVWVCRRYEEKVVRR